MATGRTVSKWTRVYAAGYDLSGYSRSIGPLAVTFDEADATTMGDPIKGALQNHPMVSPGTLNSVFDNSTGASHAVLNAMSTSHVLMVPIGVRAEPAQGDEAFCGQFMPKDFYTEAGEGVVTISVPYTGWYAGASSLLYAMPWGTLLAAKSARTAVNSSAGVDDRGAATALGGYLCYHLFSSDGTVTLKVQDAATNADGSFADLSGATSGSINASVTPASAIVPLSKTATVRRYLRWQLVFGTATTATFAMAFVRI